MFNFFKKKKVEVEEERPPFVASITYSVTEDMNTMIDIDLDDYDKKSMDALCHILATLSNEQCFLETFEILKNAIVESGNETLLVYLVTQLQVSIAENKALYPSKNEQPCVKPSDMMT